MRKNEDEGQRFREVPGIVHLLLPSMDSNEPDSHEFWKVRTGVERCRLSLLWRS